MSKKIFAVAILVMMLFAIGCQPAENNNGIEEKNAKGEYVFKGEVTNVSEKKYIVMEIIDSDIAFGTYHVLVGVTTTFFHMDDSAASRDEIKVGDIIEVAFSGQVMMSYPPQIYAQKIYIQ